MNKIIGPREEIREGGDVFQKHGSFWYTTMEGDEHDIKNFTGVSANLGMLLDRLVREQSRTRKLEEDARAAGKIGTAATRRSTSILEAIQKIIHTQDVDLLEQLSSVHEHLEEWEHLCYENDRLTDYYLRLEREKSEIAEAAVKAIETAIYCEDGLDGAVGQEIIEYINDRTLGRLTNNRRVIMSPTLFTNGSRVTDKVTGFTGTIVSTGTYLHSSPSYQVCGDGFDESGKPREVWFDQDRLKMAEPEAPAEIPAESADEVETVEEDAGDLEE